MRISSYSPKSPQANCMLVEFGTIDLYFSYQTIVAFRTPAHGLIVRENSWGPTTGKHLNWIDGGKQTRKTGAEFDDILTPLVQALDVAAIQVAKGNLASSAG